MLWIIVFLLVIIVALLGGGPVLSAIVAVVGIVFFGFLIVGFFIKEPIVASIVTGIAVLAVVLFFVWASQPEAQPRKRGANQGKPDKHPRTSAHAQELLTASEEVEPDIYHHHDGLYVARGPRGGFRIYKSLENARRYRDFGPSGRISARVGKSRSNNSK